MKKKGALSLPDVTSSALSPIRESYCFLRAGKKNFFVATMKEKVEAEPDGLWSSNVKRSKKKAKMNGTTTTTHKIFPLKTIPSSRKRYTSVITYGDGKKKKYKKTGVSVTFVPFPTQSFPGCVNVRRWAICCFHARTTEGIGNEHFGLFFFSLSLDLWGYLITFSVEDSVSDNSSFLFATAIGYPLFLVTMWFLSLILPFEEIHKVYTKQGSNGKRKKKRYNVERCVLAHFVALDSPRQRQKWRPADYRGQFWRSLHTEWR